MTNSQVYYHLAAVHLAPGSVIQPGNWGRIVSRYQAPSPTEQVFGNAWVIARELQFEAIRLSNFPDKPSRLAAAFCCPDEAHGRAYKARIDLNDFHILYEVELVDPTAATHIAPLAMVDFPPPKSLWFQETIGRAVAYWSGFPEGEQEVVTLSPLRVIGVVK